MNRPARDVYHAYHSALGTVAAAPPFEALTMREQQAWTEAVEVIEHYYELLEDARLEVQEEELKRIALQEKLHDAKIEIEGLADRIKELQKAAKGKPAAKKTRRPK